jgi:nuclear pore complex protein Nup155
MHVSKVFTYVLPGFRQELNTYAEQNDVIQSVTLVKPKPGIFIDEIRHLLVICTPVSVLLLGVQAVPAATASGRPRKELKVYATGMSIPTEVEMTSVIGTSDGRIFMAGIQDGHLYELHYQEKEGWFGKRIQLINHSVGGVSSLLPRFSNPAASGMLSTHTRK